MTASRPSDDVAAPYSATLAAIAHLADPRWRWTAADRLRDEQRANENPIQKPVVDGPQSGRESEAATARSSAGADSREVGRCGPETGGSSTRTCREGITAVAAPPATGNPFGDDDEVTPEVLADYQRCMSDFEDPA